LATPIIAIVGSRDSGKTTTTEILTKELTRRGYKVAAVKHIPEPNFTIDRMGKDTWRFAQAGAKTILSVASGEVATIEKVDATKLSLREILQRCRGNDVVLLEGFKKLVERNKSIYKIAVVKSPEEALKAARTFHPLLAFTGPHSTKDQNLGIPYTDVLKNPEEIGDIVEKILRKKPDG
jgi:molybdopterin-guanine dinucleotide biosynthesis protein B